VQVDTPQAIYDKPADRATAIFVGAPQINLFKASVKLGALAIKGTDVTLPCPAHLADRLKAKDDGFELGIRPENLLLVEAATASIKGVLADIEPLGPKSVAAVKVGEAEFRVLIDSKDVPSLELGQPIGVEPVHTERMLAFDLESGLRLKA